MPAAAETFRAREVYRYYQPRNLTETSDHIEESSEIKGLRKDSKRSNFKTQQSFSDTALTAFAQLIALRLVCQRAIVSLIDHENEYFLAESTSTLTLIDENGPAQNAWLSISGARVPRWDSLCERTLSLVPTVAEMTPVFLIPDLRLDEKMCDLDCVKRWDLRFYCGVALTNKRGVNIGCVYVVDDRPRTDFSLEQAQFLTTMAATVMDHLENIRAKEDIVRVTMMSQALHAFIEGDGTMDGDWQRLKRYNLPSGAGVGFSWETNKDDGSGLFASKSSAQNLPLKSYIDLSFSEGQSPLQHGSSHDARFNFNNSPWSSSSETPLALPLKSVLEGINEPSVPLTGGRDTEFSNSGFANLLHSTFSRASNLVREGMEIDGAVYFDAPFRFYQGRSTLETDTRVVPKKGHESSSESGDDEFIESRPGPSPHSTKGHRGYRSHHSKNTSTSSNNMGLKSEILGYSTKASSSWNNQSVDPETNFTAIDQSLLTSLVRRYPAGELFVFDQDGPISPPVEFGVDGSDTTIVSQKQQQKRARHIARKQAEILRLLSAFPGARQIFFVPLYDSTSGCFIGSFAFDKSKTRVYTPENHLSYLVAFGHSVMSEVSRLNTLSADRAKGDFISNVSHELRSPLHGILASVEFLADSKLDGFQRNLVDTVDICGRTLLDTIEHVLDFSKIKKFGSETLQPMGTVADLDVSAVIEEVLEGVFAGFEFNGLSSEGLADTTKSRARDASQLASPPVERAGFSNDALAVILDIDFCDNWKFPTVPGTWRRLTMNLFGNALKYTREGYIKIKLEAKSIPPGSSSVFSKATESTMVTLTVSDSGKGMSPEFLKSKLFLPFTQEDVTCPGTGLGMSIVKQIVDLSGGRIDIQSELGKGTEVKLSLPLANILVKPVQPPSKLKLSFAPEGPIDALRRRAKGRTVTIRGFDSGSFGDSDLRLSSLLSLKASIVKYVTEWFNLIIVSSDQVADIVISDESAFLSSATERENKFRLQVILCSNGARRNIYMSRLEPGQAVEFVSKPCGPHRIAKALLNCLDTEDALAKAGVEPRVSSNLVSLDGNASQKISTFESIVTAGASSHMRLIGNLQSSIGFSPTAGNINREVLMSKVEALRPGFKHRTSSGFVPKLETPEDVSSGSTTVSKETSDSSEKEEGTVNSSTSFFGDESPQLELTSQDASASPRKPKMLLVEDNPVNMMLLATYMKKNGWEFEQAENGLIALQAFQSRPNGFDVIFMDVSMPIMTGYESTRAIRAVESERRDAYEYQQHSRAHSPFASPMLNPSALLPASFPFHSPPSTLRGFANTNTMDLRLNSPDLKLNPPALIIALTGFSSKQDQEAAFESGVDVFMTKPVRFREVGRILEGWMRSRERAGTEVKTGTGA